jgi:hypothetical protein
MDNLNIHKMLVVRSAIEAAGATPVYLPTYSPELNPIELLWADLKRSLRTLAISDEDELRRAVRGLRRRVPTRKIHGWFGHALPHTRINRSRCVARLNDRVYVHIHAAPGRYSSRGFRRGHRRRSEARGSGSGHFPLPVSTSDRTGRTVRACHDSAARHPLLSVPEIDGDLEVEPQLRRGAERAREQDRRLRRHRPAPRDDPVHALGRLENSLPPISTIGAAAPPRTRGRPA